MTTTTPQESPIPSKRSHRAALVVALCLLGSLAIALYALRSFHNSERYLAKTLTSMREVGRLLTPPQCVEHVLAWRKRCTLMRSLCDAYVPRAMGACLEARKRVSYCAVIKDRPKTTHYGFRQCKARHLKRRMKKACAAVFRQINAHCDRELDHVKKRQRPMAQM